MEDADSDSGFDSDSNRYHAGRDELYGLRTDSHAVGPVIDKVLGLRCTSFGYQYGEIAGSLASVYFCGGDCVEDVTSHLMPQFTNFTPILSLNLPFDFLEL